MIDYHVHPDYSIDADTFTMDSFCLRALELGLQEICFTTHCEFDPTRQHFDWFVRCQGQILPMHPAERWLETYFRDVEKCAAKYVSSGLGVKAGLEAGYDLGLERDIERILSQFPFDFVIGSIHCLDHVAISSHEESQGYFPGRSLEEVGKTYFGTLREAVTTGLFDVIGHFDIYRRHGTEFFGPGIKGIHREYLGEIMERMVKTRTGLEINTSSLRHDHGSFYPGLEILETAVKAGVDIFTTGSDSHRVSELGRGIPEAMSVIKNFGISISVFNKRIPRKLSFTGAL